MLLTQVTIIKLANGNLLMTLTFSEGNICFKIQCNHNPLKTGIVPNNFAYGDFKFCPFCGRKIKWV